MELPANLIPVAPLKDHGVPLVTPNSRTGGAFVLMGSVLAYILLVVAQRLFFHPLGKLPGPIVARLSNLYNTFHIMRKDEAHNFLDLHSSYGSVVRYGPERLSIRSPDAVRMLYTNSRYTRKADSYLAFPRNPEKASLFSSINKQVHARKRRVLRHGFSNKALEMAERTIKKHVATLARCLEYLEFDDQEGSLVDDKKMGVVTGKWSTPKNWAIWVNRYSFDLSSDLSLAESFDMMRIADRRHFADIIEDNMWAENVTGSSITLLHKLQLRRLLLLGWRIPSTKPLDTFVEKMSAIRVDEVVNSSQKGDKNFMNWLMDGVETTDEATMEEIKEEVILLITAGGDTTSTTISSAMFYLLKEPEKLAKLKAEIRSTFNNVGEIIQGSKLNQCSYLRACIDEALRIAPPAGSVLRRKVEPCGVSIDGHFIPGGTDIGVPVYAMHHDEEFYPDPFKFHPERWLPGEKLLDGTVVTPEFVARAQSVFLPFSAGTRGCIGKPLAYLGISILYSTLLFKYDLRLCPDCWVNGRRSGMGPDPNDEYLVEDIFTTWKSGPLVEFRARKV